MQSDGFRSTQARARLRTRAWLVGGLSLLVQIVLPIAVLISAMATLLSSCANALNGPDANASGAAAYQGRIWFCRDEPVADDGAAAEGDDGERKHVRRMVLMSADPGGGPPREERELLRSDKLTIFDRPCQLLANQQRLWLFDDDGVTLALQDGRQPDGAAGERRPYPGGHTRSRPFLLDGRPALAQAGDEQLRVRVLDGPQPDEHGWGHHKLVDLSGPVEDMNWRTLRLMRHGQRLFGAVLSFDEKLFSLQETDAGLGLRKVADAVDDHALAVLNNRALLFYVTAGPGLEDLLDDLEDVERKPGEEKPKTMLVARALGGQQLWAKPAPGADELAAVTLGPDHIALVSEHGDGIEMRSYLRDVLDEVAVADDRSDDTSLKLFGLVLLWFFGGSLVTFIAALLMARGMTLHRDPQQLVRYASLTRRTLARGVDAALVVAAVAGVMLAVSRASGGESGGEGLGQLTGLLVGVVLLVVEARTGSSPGKRLLGIVVQNHAGQPPGLRAAFMRSMLSCVDGLFGGMVGVLTVAFSPHWQRVGDSVAHTVVVRVPGRSEAPPGGV